MPASTPILMSVESRSPTIMQSPSSTPRPLTRGLSIVGYGLPGLASHVAPVQASIAATIAAQSGSPRPPGKGQKRSGFVATRRAAGGTTIASKAIWSFA